MKKLGSLLLCLTLLLSALSMFTLPAAAATSGYYTYSVSNGKGTDGGIYELMKCD